MARQTPPPLQLLLHPRNLLRDVRHRAFKTHVIQTRKRHLKAAQHTIYSSVCGVTSDDRSSRESDSPTPPQIDSPPSTPLLPAGASCCRDLRNEKPFMEWGRGRRVTGDQGMGRLGEPPIPHKTSCFAPPATVNENLSIGNDVLRWPKTMLHVVDQNH